MLPPVYKVQKWARSCWDARNGFVQGSFLEDLITRGVYSLGHSARNGYSPMRADSDCKPICLQVGIGHSTCWSHRILNFWKTSITPPSVANLICVNVAPIPHLTLVPEKHVAEGTCSLLFASFHARMAADLSLLLASTPQGKVPSTAVALSVGIISSRLPGAWLCKLYVQQFAFKELATWGNVCSLMALRSAGSNGTKAAWAAHRLVEQAAGSL